jgi:Fe-S cluster assembly protein SufD
LFVVLQVIKEKESYLSACRLLEKKKAGQEPIWLARIRESAAARFEELDFPTTRDEEWKYTSLAPLLKSPFQSCLERDWRRVTAHELEAFTFAESRPSQLVFLNGLFAPELSSTSAIAEGILVSNLAAAVASNETLLRDHLATWADYDRQIFTALNTASIDDGAIIYLPEGSLVETPIHLLFISSAGDVPLVTHPRTLFVAGRGARATLIESYASLASDTYFTNAVTELVLNEGAVVEHYRLQEESHRAFHIATTQVHQARASRYSSCAISLGSELARHNLNLVLEEENTESSIDGLYVVNGHQHVDNHTAIDHLKPHGTSRQLYKGILDEQATAVFNGKVFVREGALLTDARQMNKNLLLSSEATVNTKPQLEIFADDVKCAHGATVGQLEEEELFYLMSRGLQPERARALLTYGFAEEVISKIKLRSVRQRLDRIVMEKLHQSLEVS